MPDPSDETSSALRRWWRRGLLSTPDEPPWPAFARELESLPAAAQRRIWEEAQASLPWFLRGQNPSFLLLVLFATSFGFLDGPFGAARTRLAATLGVGGLEWLAGILLAVAAFAPLFLVLHALQRHMLRRQLHRLVPHLCPACGYDLTGNTSGVCPECGREIDRESPEGALK